MADIDGKIAQLQDRLEQGALNGLRPAEIFFETTKESTTTIGPSKRQVSIPQVLQETQVAPYLNAIPVMDEALRKRCLPLMASIDSVNSLPNEHEKNTGLDTVVREMSVVLEDRIRNLAGLEDGNLSGGRLIGRAFGGDNPPLKFSNDRNIQESAHQMYLGYSGFVRNEVMHRLVWKYTRERVCQLLGLVDYLLFLLTQAKRVQNSSEPKKREPPL